MRRKLYALFLAALCGSVFQPAAYATSASQTLDQPWISNDGQFETDVYLYVYGNPGTVELYRSLQPDSGFELIASFDSSNGRYIDRNLRRRTSFYYKARIVNGAEVSPYSEVLEVVSLSNWYKPTLSARALSPTSVEITLTDNSYLDYNYEIGGDEFYEPVWLTDSGRSVTFIHDGLSPNTTYTYDVSAYLEGEGAPEDLHAATATVTTPSIPACANTGTIRWEVWRNYDGNVDNIPVNTTPSNVISLTKFETPQYYANIYGSRVRGYVCVPTNGNYIFYLASDDRAKLFISATESPANLTMIAEVTAAVKYGQWDKYASQQSAPVYLEAGRRYYIEARHSEINGNDFISVGWKLPDGTLERPIQGNHLMPVDLTNNQNPIVDITAPSPSETFIAPATINVKATASDPDGAIAKVELFLGSNKLGEDTSAPYEFTWSGVQPGGYTITVTATDNRGGIGSDQQFIIVNPPCSGTGQITRAVWFGVGGSSVSDIPLNTPPQYLEYITSFETPQYFENNYGQRINGYICVPQTGNYTFYISSDDQSELWLATNAADPANRTKIASVTGYTSFRNYTKYPSQKSAPIYLMAGYKYYIEVLHKEANGNDHVSVAWTLPNGTTESPIPGSRLMRVQDATTNTASTEDFIAYAPESGNDMSVYPNPVTAREFRIAFEKPGDGVNAQVQLISANGKIVTDETVPCDGDCSEIVMKLRDQVEPGLYLVNVMQGRKRRTTKLIVK